MVTSGISTNTISDKKSVIMYEHRMSVAKTIRSKMVYAESDEDPIAIAVHLYSADATHQQAVEKSKVPHAIVYLCLPRWRWT